MEAKPAISKQLYGWYAMVNGRLVERRSIERAKIEGHFVEFFIFKLFFHFMNKDMMHPKNNLDTHFNFNLKKVVALILLLSNK